VIHVIAFALALPAQTESSTASALERITALETEMELLKAQLQAEREDAARFRPSADLHVYVDLGAFVPIGDGVGVIQDVGKQVTGDRFDEFAWVFLGDLLSTTVNSRGEAADLGDLPGVERFDSVDSRGAGGFIVNEVNATATFSLGADLVLTTSINFVPRTGSDFSLGDFFDLDLAQVEWFITSDHRISIAAGKIEPVFGREHRDRKANRRFGITPSLAARYNTGTPLGLSARAQLFDDWLIVAASVTNGTATAEHFHFYDEVDSNDGKTIAGRLALHVPLERLTEVFDGPLELGISGQWGPQDRALDNSGEFWLAGVDLYYFGVDLRIKGALMKGGAPGKPADGAHRLSLDLTGYLEIDYLILPWLGVMARFDLRDAIVSVGRERIYVTNGWRLTLGVHVPITTAVILKAEYLHNGELGIVPEFQNDIVTSSFLLIY
jgi:hypothetical protein